MVFDEEEDGISATQPVGEHDGLGHAGDDSDGREDVYVALEMMFEDEDDDDGDGATHPVGEHDGVGSTKICGGCYGMEAEPNNTLQLKSIRNQCFAALRLLLQWCIVLFESCHASIRGHQSVLVLLTISTQTLLSPQRCIIIIIIIIIIVIIIIIIIIFFSQCAIYFNQDAGPG